MIAEAWGNPSEWSFSTRYAFLKMVKRWGDLGFLEFAPGGKFDVKAGGVDSNGVLLDANDTAQYSEFLDALGWEVLNPMTWETGARAIFQNDELGELFYFWTVVDAALKACAELNTPLTYQIATLVTLEAQKRRRKRKGGN